VRAFDPLVLALAAIVLLLLTLMASLLPARRAASVELTQALRTE
jgi:putative ABC transport system permease protein